MPQSGPTVSIPTKLLATAVAITLAVVVCATAATVIVASDVSGRHDRNSAVEPDFARVAATSFRDVNSTRHLIDSLVAPLGPTTAASRADMELLTALAASRSANNQVWAAAPLNKYLEPRPAPNPPPLRLRFMPDSLGVELATQLAADTTTPWLAVFRRLARNQPLPPLWSYRPGLPGVQMIPQLPTKDFRGLRGIFLANENAGLLALRDGQPRVAMERARENLAVSRHLLEQPISLDVILGRYFARRSAQLLVISARDAHDEPTMRAARHLDTLVSDASNYMPIFQWLARQEADPRSTAVEKVAANAALPPFMRLGALNAIMFGSCRNTPEMVFGFNPVRREALSRAVNSIRDIPRGRELGELYLGWFDTVLENPLSQLPTLRDGTPSRLAVLGALDWMVPPGVRARIALCSRSW